jgi:hypothetical protein
VKEWGFSQRRVSGAGRRVDERMERPMRAMSPGVAYIPPALGVVSTVRCI